MANWSARKDDVVQQLRFLNVDELTEFCTSSDIGIPPAKTGNRDAIHTLIMRFINSETVEDSDDQGLQLFTEMDAKLKQLLALRDDDGDDDKTVMTTEVTAQGDGTSGGNLRNSNNANNHIANN